MRYAINPIEKSVTTGAQGCKHEYDYLIMALGAEYAPEKIDGFAENKGFNLYDAEQFSKLRKEILALRQGRIAICIPAFHTNAHRRHMRRLCLLTIFYKKQDKGKC